MSTESRAEHVAPSGTTGSVTNGPVNSDGYTWYEIAYDDGVSDGWSAANWLEATRFKMNDRAVTTDYLWVRDGPGTSSTHIDDVPSGTRMNLRESAPIDGANNSRLPTRGGTTTESDRRWYNDQHVVDVDGYHSEG